jgi:hypothetical protein
MSRLYHECAITYSTGIVLQRGKHGCFMISGLRQMILDRFSARESVGGYHMRQTMLQDADQDEEVKRMLEDELGLA